MRATIRNFTAGSPHRIILKNLTRMESLSEPPIRLGMDGYYEANQDYNGCAYVYTPVLPEEYPMGEEAELPEICVLVGEMQLMTLAGEEYNLNNPLLIDSTNKNQFNGKTITGSYCPSTRPSDYLKIKGRYHN